VEPAAMSWWQVIFLAVVMVVLGTRVVAAT
jgi:hypothetical protein